MQRLRVEGYPVNLPERPGGAPAPRQAPSFLQQLREAQGRQRLGDLLTAIEREAAAVAQGLSLSALRRYRELVRAFLREVLQQGYSLRREADWDFRSWEHRTLAVVDRVDRQLDDLARLLLRREQDRLTILARLGEIKGLLLDLMA